MNTDGGMRRSSDDEPGEGEAAIGVVLNEPGDRRVTTFKERIGKETIQGAEYRALIEGLEIAFEHEIGKFRVYVDNQLVVDQINDLARVKSDHLKPLHCKALALLKQFDDQRVYPGAQRAEHRRGQACKGGVKRARRYKAEMCRLRGACRVGLPG